MTSTRQRRWWMAGVAAAIAASTYRAGVGGDLVNTGGWSSFAEFWAGMFDLRLDGEFLSLVWSATLTTLSFAVLGTILQRVEEEGGSAEGPAGDKEPSGGRKPAAEEEPD